MKASEFVAAYRSKPYTAWEQAAVDLATGGGLVRWPLLPLALTSPKVPGRTLVVRVASDVLAIGEPGDHLRLPLTPRPAQRIANAFGMLLPTQKIATEIGLRAPVRLTPQPMAPNRGANLQQYADHDAAIEGQLAHLSNRGAGIVTGHKKDVVVGKLVRPDRPGPVIWGWFWPDDPAVHGPYMTDNLRAGNPIQPYSDAHTTQDFVDYSHGERLVSGDATLDGAPVKLAAILTDPALAWLASDEGLLSQDQICYRTPPLAAVTPVVPYEYNASPDAGLAERGLDYVRRTAIERGSGS